MIFTLIRTWKTSATLKHLILRSKLDFRGFSPTKHKWKLETSRQMFYDADLLS